MKQISKNEMRFDEKLKNLRACSNAVAWVGERDEAQAWAECERADWMLWYAAQVLRRKDVVILACACARTAALKYVPEGELRPIRAIETAEKWTRGEATMDEVREAAAAYAYDYDYASASDAAAAAYDAAASASASAAAAAYDAAARAEAEKNMCEIIRKLKPVIDM